MHIIDLHRRALDAVRPIVARVRPADLDRPTPCAGWDLRTLLSHMIGQDHGFAAAVLADVSAEAFAPRTPTIEAHEAGAAAVVAAFAAADPVRQVLLAELGGRRFPLPSVIGFHLLDTLVHGWDVAVSLDTGVDYDDDLLAAAQTQAELVPAGPARAPAFGPILPIADESTAWARTLALLGRDSHWTVERSPSARTPAGR
ncbi:TIGR03086 family metal-binding protein [Actinophytocola xanthii]|uniref:TIGR03086 family protein n=1 Tax=Actinophytocola xanthii TaxID=1912961 RepID=A0A1Q8C7V2_9PSEU|nr:TIGR03086 family metal-binding protein [Actinophytocola xanthii]OLF10383.1 TIGR03086 family protein [Actinophytocola xanthii]